MTLYDKQQPESIRAMFDAIAPKYDCANGILSLQLHRYWNQKLVESFPSRPGDLGEATLTDLCCGTGEIAYRWLQMQGGRSKAYLVDFSSEMLAAAKTKAEKLGINSKASVDYLEADVHALPLPDEMCDYASMAYGIRNVSSPAICFKEVHRILRPGGQLRVLELTRPKNRLMCCLHGFYLRRVLPLLGRWLTSNRDAYCYLGTSIGAFVDPINLKADMQAVGFCNITITPLSGGIATLIAAQK